jgi:hypothetical protein
MIQVMKDEGGGMKSKTEVSSSSFKTYPLKHLRPSAFICGQNFLAQQALLIAPG